MTRILAITGWTLLAVVAVWAFVVAFVGVPSLASFVVPFALVAFAWVLIGAGHELERRRVA